MAPRHESYGERRGRKRAVRGVVRSAECGKGETGQRMKFLHLSDLHLGKVMWASNKALGYRFFDTRYVRIVDKYMRKHQKVSLKALLESDDYSKMLP